MSAVNQLFIEKVEGERTSYPLNTALNLQFGSEQEATQFLVAAIRLWKDKRSFFCHDITSRREGEGEHAKYVDLPEDELKYFAENGRDRTVRLIEERKQEAARKKAEAEAAHQLKLREEQNAKLTERFNMIISAELRQQILPYADNKSLVIVSPIVAAVLTSRSEWGSSGGVGYYSQVRAFCGNQTDLKEWQWRDRYSASNDKPWLAVHAIGAVKISEKNNTVNIEIELINNQHGKRTATYTFDQPQTTKVKALSLDEQAAFTTQVEKETSRIMAELDQLWELKPKMINPHPLFMAEGYVPYLRPSIKQRECRPEIGVAAFVTEEQIDHRVSDPQIRHELYVLTAGDERAECKAEDHGYGQQGGAFLTIIEVGAERIVINTKKGKTTIALHQSPPGPEDQQA